MMGGEMMGGRQAGGQAGRWAGGWEQGMEGRVSRSSLLSLPRAFLSLPHINIIGLDREKDFVWKFLVEL